MAHSATRPDLDLVDDIDTLIVRYPPLKADRKHLHFFIKDGVITVSGHLRTAITRRYLLERLPLLPGVRAVLADALYDDETLQRDAGRMIAAQHADGALANVQYGVVIVTGTLPAGHGADEFAARLAEILGVVRIAAKLA